MKKFLFALVAVLLFVGAVSTISFPAFASGEAENISKNVTLSGTGYASFGFLTDGNINYYPASSGNTVINVDSEKAIGSLYIMFSLEYGEYTITANGETVKVGKYGFLHEYIDISSLFEDDVTSLTIEFSSGSVRLSEIFVFTEGETPSFVQKWAPPLEDGADLLLFATHGDDDQLFFAGLLPHYAWYKGYRVQVAYLTDHRNLTGQRVHEMLNGLWAVGVTAYPVFGSFADFRIDSLEQTYAYYQALGTTKDALYSFVTEQIRRFKPLVVVTHDFKGEYGHGMHQVYADLTSQAVKITNDSSVFPESYEKYGGWEVQKAYFHLYGENEIVMDFDTPQDCFDGLSAFQVSQKYGYPCHVSQQPTWFTQWISGYSGEITKASQIKTYNPCQYGLYFSTVGEDKNKNDMFENVITYAEQERIQLEKEESERLEQSRIEQSVADELSRQEEQSRLDESSRLLEESKNNLSNTSDTSSASEVDDGQKQTLLAAGVMLCVFSPLIIYLATRKRK